MSKQLIIYILLFFNGTSYMYAQWTEKDSLWLQEVLSGKDSIRLNPETMKAIQKGILLNVDPHSSPMLNSPMQLPILKDFSEYIETNDSIRKVALTDLPPSVFLRHPIAYKEMSRYKVNPDFFNMFGRWLDYQGVKHTGAMRNYDANNGVNTDFNHALSKLFSSEYRQWVRNKENAKKLKDYNNPSTREIEKKRKKYLKEQQALPLPTVTIVNRKDTIRQVIDSLRHLPQLSTFKVDTTILEIKTDSILYELWPN